MSDAEWMLQAIALAHDARFTTSPRPWVGCVLVTEAGEVFSGVTAGKGGPHAEQIALSKAGAQARGATLYVTLEPCPHHGLTPPCTDAIISAGLKRVVVALRDPDERVNGQGIAQLQKAGIKTSVGTCAAAAGRQLAPYLTHRRLRRPFVTVKLAATLDARTALADGTSKWITGPHARADAHLLRAEVDAVLVGANTARRDNPWLTVRDAILPAGIKLWQVQPQRFVLGQIPANSNLLAANPRAGVLPAQELAGSLKEILPQLAEQDIVSLLVEGGATVAAAFHEAQLVDRYVFYLAAAVAGGNQALPLFNGQTATKISDLWRGRIVDLTLLGDDIRVELEPAPAPMPDLI